MSPSGQNSSKNIFLIEPFFSGSHQQWAEELKKFSKHRIELWTLPGRHWKWRMEGAAIHFARRINEQDFVPDVFLVSDMLDVALFKSLLKPDFSKVPILLYFHENQFAYPSNENNDRQEYQYAWKNYTSCLTADHICFNSTFNRESFLKGIRDLLKRLPDAQEADFIEEKTQSFEVLPLGLELPEFITERKENNIPVILWNHRKEFDKGPDEFFELLYSLRKQKFKFKLIVLGEEFESQPNIFEQAKLDFKAETLFWGYADTRAQYWKYLRMADLIPVTSRHDFFGISVVEAVHAGLYPILPNRLAYPEHFSPAQYPNHFYSTADELLFKTMNWQGRSELSVLNYSWKFIIDRYDALLDEVSK